MAGRWGTDPWGRHELRWWDERWTEHVSDGGRAAIDSHPLDAGMAPTPPPRPPLTMTAPPIVPPPMEDRAAEVPSSSRPARSIQKRIVIAGLVVLAAFGADRIIGRLTRDDTVDTASIERDIADQISRTVGTSVSVSCPSAMHSRKGKIYDCVATDSTDERFVRVTFDDGEGHFTFQLTGQTPP